MSPVSDLLVARSPLFLGHRIDESHPECPERLKVVLTAFDADERLAAIPQLEPRGASTEELRRFHAAEMIETLLAQRGRQGWVDSDTYLGEKSVDVALSAAGAAIDAALRVWKGDARRAFCLVRPPGHHATRAAAMGFCLFNNVALAAAAVLAEAPQARLAVVDFDLHHGNGTQDAFYSDERVLFVSSHRYPFYPGTGKISETGAGAGTGTTVNFPMPRPFGDETFEALYGGLLPPVLAEFRPDMLIVSAGYDGHADDPMNGFRLSTPGFGRITRVLLSAAERHCRGRVLFCLEGGYNPFALKDSVVESLVEMIECPREPFPVETRFEPEDPGLVDSYRAALKPFYRSL